MTAAELQQLAQQLTAYLVEQGYVNSGVILPDQKVDDGVIYLQMVAGRVADTVITGNQRLHDSYIVDRLGDLRGTTLNVKSIAAHLQLLEQDPRIGKLNVAVKPSAERGAALLNIDVEEAPAFGFSLSADNHLSPNVGGGELGLELHHLNLFGFGDTAQLILVYAEGFQSGAAIYSVPVTSRGTTLTADFGHDSSQVVSEPFDELDIEGESTRYGVEVRHPLMRSADSELALGLGLHVQRVESFLLGEPFAFSATDDNGVSQTSLLTFTQEWVRRNADHVFAVRSSFNAGLDLPGATIGGEADGEFMFWLLQAQWLQKLSWRDSMLGVRMQTRLSNDTLPAYYKYALGGAESVRGYRENLITRDQGFLLTLDWSFPVAHLPVPGLSRNASDGEVRVIPFADYGYGQDYNETLTRAEDAASIGVRTAVADQSPSHRRARVRAGPDRSRHSQCRQGAAGPGHSLQCVDRLVAMPKVTRFRCRSVLLPYRQLLLCALLVLPFASAVSKAAQSAPSAQSGPSAQFDRALASHQRGDFSQAVTLWRELLATRDITPPLSLRVSLGVADACWRMGLYQEGLSALRDAEPFLKSAGDARLAVQYNSSWEPAAGNHQHREALAALNAAAVQAQQAGESTPCMPAY